MTQSRFIERHFLVSFWSLFFIGLCLSVLFAYHQILTGDQIQMLDKGYLGARTGEWLSYGNAASAVGNVPGSLSAYIIGFPLLIWDSPWAPMGLLILLHMAAFLLFDSVVKSAFNKDTRMLLMLLFWLSPWLMFENLLYNPSYLFFAATLHLWSALQLRQRASFWHSLIHVLSIGFAMQLHYSWPILAVASVLLFYRKIIHIHWRGLICAFALLLTSLIPYFIEQQNNPSISRESDRYIGYGAVHIYPVVKALLYWLRYGSMLFSTKLMSGAEFTWLNSSEEIRTILRYGWQALLYLVGLASLILSVKINYRAWKQIKPLLPRTIAQATTIQTTTITTESWLLLYSFATLVGVLIAAALSPITFSYWHLIIAFPAALLPLSIAANQWMKEHPVRKTTLFTAVFLYFLAVNLMAAHDSKKFSYAEDYQQQVEKHLLR